MTEPLNYTSAFDNLPSPVQAFTQGLQSGSLVNDVMAKQQQQQLALQQAQQMRMDLQSLMANPTPKAIGAMSIKYPQLSEAMKRSADILTPEQRQSQISQAIPIYAATLNGEPEVASNLLQKQAEAMRNSGDNHGATAAETMAALIKAHPEFAKANGGMWLANLMGPDKFVTTFSGIGGEQRAGEQAPAALKKITAEANKAEAEAKVAVGTVPALIQKPVEENLSAAAKRRVDELNVQISQADSETKRGQLVLERDKLIAEQGKKGTESGDAAQAQVDSAQHAIDTIASLRADPLMKDSTGNYFAGMGTVLGKLLGVVPGTENKDFRGQLESLKSQVFLPAVQQVKGMGALSNAEGEKLTAAVAALDADMSPKAFQNALGVVEKYVNKGMQKGLANKNIPVQGGGFVMSHPTFGNVSEGDINRLLKSSPGATRQQVIDFLRISGGK